MTREEYNKRAAARKKKSIIIKSSLGLAAFFMFAGIIGKIDQDTYAGIHSVKGTVSASGNYILIKSNMRCIETKNIPFTRG